MLSIKKTFAHLNVKRLYFAGEIISLPIGQSHFDKFLRQFKKKTGKSYGRHTARRKICKLENE